MRKLERFSLWGIRSCRPNAKLVNFISAALTFFGFCPLAQTNRAWGLEISWNWLIKPIRVRIVEERGNRERRREGGEEKLSDRIVKKLLSGKRLKKVLWEKWNYIRRMRTGSKFRWSLIWSILSCTSILTCISLWTEFSVFLFLVANSYLYILDRLGCRNVNFQIFKYSRYVNWKLTRWKQIWRF